MKYYYMAEVRDQSVEEFIGLEGLEPEFYSKSPL